MAKARYAPWGVSLERCNRMVRAHASTTLSSIVMLGSGTVLLLAGKPIGEWLITLAVGLTIGAASN